MQGNVLITVMVLLAVLSASVIYNARESFVAYQNSLTQKDALQLNVWIDEALLLAENEIAALPPDFVAVPPSACYHAPCILTLQASNLFLEETDAWWQAPANLIPIWFDLPHARVGLILEDLSEQNIRGTLLFSLPNGSALRMQATWNRSTLNPLRLGWRRI